MSWWPNINNFKPSLFTEAVKRRACGFILRRYGCGWLKEKAINLDQLTLDLYEGKASLNNFELDVVNINEMLEENGLPIEVVDCFIGRIGALVPWHSIFTDNSVLEVENLEMTIKHVARSESETSLFDSMLFNSMTTSMKLAEECLKQDPTIGENKVDPAIPYEGVQDLACTVEAIFVKIKANLINTTICYEHIDEERNILVTLELKIDRIEYHDESANESGDNSSKADTNNSCNNKHKTDHQFDSKSASTFTIEDDDEEFTKKRNKTSLKSDDNDSTRTKCCTLTLLRIKNIQISGIKLYYNETPINSNDNEKSLNEGANKQKNDKPALIMMVTDTQEVKVRIIQDALKLGPEIEVEKSLGNLHLFLCPRILASVSSIINKITQSTKTTKHNMPVNKRIQPDDYERIKKGLETASLLNVSGSGKQTFEHSDEEEPTNSLYFAATDSRSKLFSHHYHNSSNNNNNGVGGSDWLSNSGFQSMKSSCTSLSSGPSSTSHQHSSNPKNFQRNQTEEACASTSIQAKINFISIVVLHVDPSPTNQQQGCTSELLELGQMTDEHFSKVRNLALKDENDLKDILKIRQDFSRAIDQDHLCFLFKFGSLEITKQNMPTMLQEKKLVVDVSFACVDFVEAIFQQPENIENNVSDKNEIFSLNLSGGVLPDYSELLVFERSTTSPYVQTYKMQQSIYDTRPAISIKVEVVDKKKYHIRSKMKQSTTTMSINMTKCYSEIDVTAVDRLHWLLSSLSPTSNNKNNNNGNNNNNYGAPMYQSLNGMLSSFDDLSSNPSHNFNVEVLTSLWSFKLRFPKVDLTSCDKKKKIINKRRLHQEFMVVDLVESKLKTSFGQEQNCLFEITCINATCSLVHKNHTKNTILRISSDSTIEEQREGFNWPRFVIKQMSNTYNRTLLVDNNKGMDTKVLESMYRNQYSILHNVDQAPFSSRRNLYNNEELICPGDRNEMSAFQDVVSNNSRIFIDVNVPHVQIFINNKDTLELLYNRFLSDLALWQPQPTSSSSSPTSYDAHNLLTYNHWSSFNHMNPYNAVYDFSSYKSNINADSNSDSDEECSDAWKKQTKTNEENTLCLSVAFKRAQLVAYCLDSTTVPTSSATTATSSQTTTATSTQTTTTTTQTTGKTKMVGKVYMDLEDSHILFVYGYHGDPEIQYLCLQVFNAQLYHNGQFQQQTNKLATFEEEFISGILSNTTNPTLTRNMNRVLYTSNIGISEKGNRDVLSATIKMRSESFQQLMHYKVAVALRCCAMKHYEGTTDNYWITQLADLFTLIDYDIPGYQLPQAVMELNFQLMDCSIDYQPTNLPYHSVLYCQMFSIASTVIPETLGSMTRFILEDAGLFLSKRTNEENVNLEKNYVCVVDVSSIEINWKQSTATDEKSPQLNIDSTIGELNIRTCSDSLVGLMELLIHVANVVENNQKSSSSPTLSSSSSSLSLSSTTSAANAEDIPPSLSSRNGVGGMSDEDHHHHLVSLLVDDAMRDEIDEDDSKMTSSEILSASLSSSLTSSLTSGVTSPHQPVHRLTFDEKPVASVFYNTCANSLSASIDVNDDNDDGDDDEDDGRSGKGGGSGGNGGRVGGGGGGNDDGPSTKEEFCIVSRPEYMVPFTANSVPVIRMLTDEPIQIIPDFFKPLKERPDIMKGPSNFPTPIETYAINKMSIIWHMFGGLDFKHGNRHLPGRGRQSLASKFRGWRFHCGPHRNVEVLMRLKLMKIRFQHEKYPPNHKQSTRDVLLIHEIEIIDEVAVSGINKFLHLYYSDEVPKKTFAHMLVVKCLQERPEVDDVQCECALKISLQPIKLNIDQDSLMFMCTFFSEISSFASRNIPPTTTSTVTSQHVTPTKNVVTPTPPSSIQQQQSYEPDLLKFDDDDVADDDEKLGDEVASVLLQQQNAEEIDDFFPGNKPTYTPIFFSSLRFGPDVIIKIDYKGKRIDHNSIMGVVAGLTQLNCSQIVLKSLHYRHGILGVDKLVMYMVNEWVGDIRRNQISSLLVGVGPMHSLVQLVHGCIDLFWLPVEQYRKDGRIMKGLRRGTHSFATCTALSALELTNKMLQTIQMIAEAAHDIVSSGPSIQSKYKLAGIKHRHAAHPMDLRDGVSMAYTVVREGFTNRYTEFYTEVLKEHEQKGVPGAIGGVLRQIPPTIIAPVIIATEATGNVLGGMRNQLVPIKKKEDEDKWKMEPKLIL